MLQEVPKIIKKIVTLLLDYKEFFSKAKVLTINRFSETFQENELRLAAR